MRKLILYHGTSEGNAKRIMKEGFVPDIKYNWNVKSKKGFVYLSLAYAPFYAMNCGSKKLALIKVEVLVKDLYPEDDFIMRGVGKPVYTQAELDSINLRKYKFLWNKSLEYLGNVAVRPSKIKILGVRYFDGKMLIMKCDPCIVPMNYQIMGEYYNELTEWIYDGNNFRNFKSFSEEIKCQ